MNAEHFDKKPPHGGHDDDKDGVKLHFEHVASVQDVKFQVSWGETLRQAWDFAYKKLNEDRRAEDRLQSDDGVDMTPFLDKTMKQLFDGKHTKSHKFQIVGPTGGA